MENLHKQMDIGQCPYEGECQLCKSACSVDVYCFIKQLFKYAQPHLKFVYHLETHLYTCIIIS